MIPLWEAVTIVSATLARAGASSRRGTLPVAIFCSFFVDYSVSSLTGAVKE